MKTTKRIVSTILVVLICLTSAPLNCFMEIKWEGFDFPEFDFSEIFTTEAKAATSGYYTYTVSYGEATITDVDTSISGDVTIPSTLGGYPVTFIGWNAFDGCTGLSSITIPDSVTYIGDYAFYGCTGLSSITIPNSVTSIGDNAFKYCTRLISITIPDSVTSIGESAFANCTSLTSITVDDNNQKYSNDEFGVLFNKKKTELVQFPAGSTKTTYNIPDSVTSIEKYAISSCTNLTSITIPDSVTRIGEAAFGYCSSLTSITIPDSVTSIGDEAFGYCSSLTSITVDDNNQNYSSDEFGVLFNKNKTELIQFPAGSLEISYNIPDSVTSIGISAFADCDGLTSITIPDSVTSIGDWAFFSCDSLASITISDSVTSIGRAAFYSCDSLASITIPDSVTSIGESAFAYCNGLTSITIPDSVTSIGRYAFAYCNGLTSITIPDSVTSIGDCAFRSCSSLTSVTFRNPETKIYDNSSTIFTAAVIHGYEGSTAQAYAEKYNREFVVIAPDDTDDTEDGSTSSQKIIFLEIGDTYQVNVFSEAGKNITDSLYWKTSADSGISIEGPGYIKATKYGLHTLTANKDDSEICLDSESWYVFVGNPNVINYSTIYDSVYYYSNGGFISNAAQISDAVEVYMAFENTLEENLLELYNKDFEDIYEDQISSLDLDIGSFTITATVSGNDLSFSKDEYKNSYTAEFDGIDRFTIADDLLMLYPHNISVSGNKKNYTISIKVESEDFETIEDTITFSVADLASKAANEHIEWMSTNLPYKTSLHNAFGKEMVNLKNDGEYKWSKFSTFDFDNYYEVVVADMLLQMLGAFQMQMPSLVPDVIKEFLSAKKEVYSLINTIAFDKTTEFIDFKENTPDKLFNKVAKFRNKDAEYTKDITYQFINKLFGKKDNIDKINKTFENIDKTKQFMKIASLGVNTAENVIDFINRICILNSFKNASNSLIEVFRHLYYEIPASEDMMRDAVEDFIVYAEDELGMADTVVEEIVTMEIQFAVDLFSAFLGKSCLEMFGGLIVNWIGTFSYAGATLSSTAAFATISSTVGLIIAGVSVELCVLDILCNSTEKSAEMSKVVAMSAFSPYIVETVKYYENKLYTDRNDAAVELFEQAFAMHKTSQIYIVEHTRKAMIIKRDSLIENLFNRKGEYEGVLADTLAIQREMEGMTCHSPEAIDTTVRKTKVIAVMCPVDVFVYDKNGELVVQISDNKVVYCAENIDVCLADSQKFIVVPADSEYDIKIIATDEGTMDYKIFEYDESINLVRKIEKTDILLTDKKEFTGNIPDSSEEIADAKEYSLYSGKETHETEVVPAHTHTEEILPAVAATCTKTGLTEGKKCSVCGEILIKQIKTEKLAHKYTSEVTKAATCSAEGVKTFTCSCGDSYTEKIAVDANAHSWDGGKVTTTATCKVSGVKTYTCQHNASHKKTENLGVNASNHVNTKNVAEVKATCTVKGYTAGVFCNDCQKYISGHKEIAIDANAHSWDGGKVTTVATCKVNGVKTYTCQHNASHKKTENLGVNASNHVNTKNVAEVKATCTVKGYTAGVFCNDCQKYISGHKEIAINASNHVNTKNVAEVKPTTENVGYTAGVYCNDCKKYISGHSEIPKIAASFTDSENAKKDGNNVLVNQGLSSKELLSQAGKNAVIKDTKGNVLAADKLPGTGMTLILADGKKYVIVVFGDLDGSGTITAADARLTLRASVGLESYQDGSAQHKAANVESKDKLSAADARLILRASVGLENPKSWMK